MNPEVKVGLPDHEYHADLQAAIHAPMTSDTRLFFFRAATRLAAEDLERLESFGRGES